MHGMNLMEKKYFDLIVLGGGPGGYVAAIRAAQKGLNVALIEAKQMGGTCLNRGCIPSKALIANAEVLRKVRHAKEWSIAVGEVSFNYSSMEERKDRVVDKVRKSLEGLILSNKITVFKGFGKFTSPHEIKVLGENEAVLEAKNIIIATGSEPRGLSLFPFDYERVHDSTSLLDLKKLPRSLIIVGGGVIGCEFASMHHEFGVDVTILELLPFILSTEGKEVGDFLANSFRKRGMKVETSVSLTKMEKKDSSVVFTTKEGKTFEAEAALISVGRRLNSDQIGIEKTGVIVEQNGSIQVNEFMQTNVSHIYAIGDVTGKWLLAHVASHQGLAAVEAILGHPVKINEGAIPSVIFTHPEVASVGLTLEKALQKGYDAVIGKYPLQALGKAQAINETEGFAQVVISKSTGQIFGAQVIGNEATSLIAEMALAIENELTVESIHETIHAHPTFAEAWAEATLLASNLPLHFPPKSKG